MAFSGTDAAIEGFRIAVQKPMAIATWAVTSLLISLVSSVAMVSFFGGTLNEMASMRGPDTDPAQAMAVMGQMGLLYLFLMPVALLIFSIFTTAVYRTVLRPSDSAFGYLRFGAAEFRMAVVLLVLFLLSIVVMVASAVLIAIVGAIAAVATGAGSSGDGNLGAAVIFALLVVALYIGMFFIGLAFWTKFSFAGPMTFAEGRIRIFESWGATKGHFWNLFGCYILAAVLGIVVSMLGAGISMALMLGFGRDLAGATDFMSLIESMQADYTSLAAFLTPAIIVNLIVNSLFSALTYAIWLAPPAVAYRDIVGAPASEPAPVD